MPTTPTRASVTAALVFALASPAAVVAQRGARPAEAPPRSALQPPREPEPVVDLEAILRGEGRGLTADRAAARAVATAPSVDGARALVRQAQAGAERAMYGFIPQLTLSARYTRLSEIDNATFFEAPNDTEVAALRAGYGALSDPVAEQLWNAQLDAQIAQASFTFPILLDMFAFRATLTYPVSQVFLQVLPSYEAAVGLAVAQRHRVEAERSQVALQAREAFYGYARARGALAVARIAARQAEVREAQVRAFLEAGTAARVDHLRVRAQVAAARVAVARAEGGVAVSAEALRTLLHLDGSGPVAVGEDVLADLPELRGTPAQLTARAFRRRPEARALRRMIAARRRSVDAAEGSRYPALLISGNADLANPHPRVFPQTQEFRGSWDVSAVLQWSPHDLLEGERQADEARAQLGQARADLRTLADAIRMQVTQAVQGYRSAREALSAARLGVEAAEESYRVRMERFRAGAAVVSDVVDASTEQVRAQLDLVNAAIDARVALARLRRATAAGEPAPR